MAEPVAPMSDEDLFFRKLLFGGIPQDISAGFQRGAANQAQGLFAMAQDPVGAGQAIFGAAKGFFEHPGQSIKDAYGRAVDAFQQPGTAAQYLTEMANPRNPLGLGNLAKQGPIFGMTAYHGSPHLFDKFEMSKVGTGEGAQAYGHGLYFAENPNVAGQYAREVIDKAWFDKTNAELTRLSREMDKHAGGEYGKFRDAEGYALKEQYDALLTERANKKGNLYHVDIPDEAIAKMLDWDAPLSKQPESIRKILDAADFGGDPVIAAWKTNGAWPHISGQTLYRHMADGLTVGAAERGAGKAASEYLNSIGIPGLKYLDQGSRGAAEGTRNFVLFDENLAKITKRE